MESYGKGDIGEGKYAPEVYHTSKPAMDPLPSLREKSPFAPGNVAPMQRDQDFEASQPL